MTVEWGLLVFDVGLGLVWYWLEWGSPGSSNSVKCHLERSLAQVIYIHNYIIMICFTLYVLNYKHERWKFSSIVS